MAMLNTCSSSEDDAIEDGAEDDHFRIIEQSINNKDDDGMGDSSDDESHETTASLFNDDACDPEESQDHCSILKPAELLKYMNQTIRDVNQVTQLPNDVIWSLLFYFKWDSVTLIERFFETNVSKFFKQAGIPDIQNEFQGKGIPPIDAEADFGAETVFCEICVINHTETDMFAVRCDHKFCMECWQGYLKSKIVDEGLGQLIYCPAHKCKVKIDSETISKIVPSKTTLTRYKQHILNDFVNLCKKFRWCPGVNCENAIRYTGQSNHPCKCTCGTVSCFKCGADWHDPIQCSLLKLWLKKCDDDSETLNWMATHTKECPACHASIEKTGGCNHITCRNSTCRHEFCWMCLGPWKPHGSSWYVCNRYSELECQKARSEHETSRSALHRYLHYYNRYINHHHSLRMENKLHKSIRAKMGDMQKMGFSWIEVQFLQIAVNILLRCRRTLMHTYAFAFYLDRTNQSEVFEQNQADLERSTEDLSHHLEKDLSEIRIISLKQIVQDRYRYCDSRRKVLVAHVHEGYEQGYWVYREKITV